MMEATLVKHTFGAELYHLPPRVLVVIPTAWDTVSDSEQQLLARILGSVKLSLAAVQIVCGSAFSVEDSSVYQSKAILSFGVPVAGVTRPYEVVVIDDVSVIVADVMDALDDARKKNLWAALKQVFKL
ncbi:MAG TPA: hypothetical protein VK658_25880 [Chryseolinea sp.]|nr:hypothetical protein [Chryseolinea sp.]